MSTRPTIPLTAIQTFPGKPEYRDLLSWPFAAEPFYKAQVRRLLENDIPHRVAFSLCRVWISRDPDGTTVGFGTLDVCEEYKQFAEGKSHFYIPVLGVNPTFERRGHGRTIVQHLIAEAALLARFWHEVSDTLFLDVYTANAGAIALYNKCGFTTMNPDTPIRDPEENNEQYVIMAMNVAIAGM
jgi:ribosomal protein S18 acetylase RimI-like enzyme